MQHIVRRRVRIEHRDVLAQHIHQFFVRNDDERIDFLRQLLDACTRDALPLPFELEGPRDDGDGENAEAFRNVGDHGCSAGSGAAAHSRRDEQHVGAFDRFCDAVAVLHRRIATDLGPRACAEPARQRRTQLQLRARRRALQCLCIGVGADEIDAGQSSFDHVLHRIAAAAADADDLDDGSVFHCLIDDLEHDVSHLLSNYRK